MVSITATPSTILVRSCDLGMYQSKIKVRTLEQVYDAVSRLCSYRLSLLLL